MAQDKEIIIRTRLVIENSYLMSTSDVDATVKEFIRTHDPELEIVSVNDKPWVPAPDEDEEED